MTAPRPTLAELESRAREVGRALAKEIPASQGYGFALIVFNLGPGGHCTYTSNGQRQDMVAALKELLAHLETGAIAPHGHHNHIANKPGQS
jgi:hypothetical protein